MDPSEQSLQVTEPVIKYKIQKYLQRLDNKEKLNSSEDDDETARQIKEKGKSKVKEKEIEEIEEGEEGEEEEGEEGEEGKGEITEIVADEGDEDYEDEDQEYEERGQGGYKDDYYSSENEERVAKQLKKKYM